MIPLTYHANPADSTYRTKDSKNCLPLHHITDIVLAKQNKVCKFLSVCACVVGN
jgi:hypothetical protein